ncbi:TfoX/Sxy family protein [Diaphorobacter sp. HDW4B]|uniref:TfoX/Sxy family protein n=1 Tax=Diaphorobacter sp. HDW4B TaxID=2714925 RepID=UPI001408A4A4|nr:TfoX/Sxy family protein [Diaphorobacter sp. HDW4B]QIL73015.1 TfoX/Sxy family protein [Diaphorobacter sp. HDW4B]
MPPRPLTDETLQLIAAVRDALVHCADVEERTMFGWYVFMVDGKMCLGVKGDELLVRLPPSEHDRVAERPGVRTLDAQGKMQGYFCVEPSAYATRAQWQEWVDGALAYNPSAKASARRKPAAKKAPAKAATKTTKKKRHSIFESDL